MKAYELADKLKLFWHTENDNLFEDTANMLRQQANRIAELEKAQIKELSDEEIISCMGMEMKTLREEALDFAKAILKKASEK